MATERGSLGFGQRLVLFGAWLVSCGFVYVLGVYVGKGMHDRGPVSPGVSLPVDAAVPPAPPPDAQAPLTFYDVLGTQQGAPSAARPPQAAPAARPAQAEGTMTEQKLASATPAPAASAPTPPPAAPAAPSPAAPVRSAPPVASPQPAKPVATQTPSPAAGTVAPIAAAQPPLPATKPPTASPLPAVGAAPAVVPAPPPTLHAAATPPPAPPTASGLPAQTASGRWTVYANPSRDQLAIEHERAALRAKGYPAEVVTLRRDGDTWYRIRVGRYATEAQAEEASRKLRTDGVGHAFVQSE